MWCPPWTRRVTMFRPMRPRPTKPSSIRVSVRLAPKGFREARQRGVQQARVGRRQMDVHCAPAGCVEGGEVAKPLRELERAERERAAGNLEVFHGLRGDQDEHA